MANTLYQVNKGINKPIEFKGIKAQYIGYMAVGLVLLLLLFAILYICGVNTYLCMAVIGASGTGLFIQVNKISKKYGRYGLMKKAAAKATPEYLSCRSIKLFINLNADTSCHTQQQ